MHLLPLLIIILPAALCQHQYQQIMSPPTNQHRLPVQPPGREFLYTPEHSSAPPPPIKFSTGGVVSSDDSSSSSSQATYEPKSQPSVSLADTIGPQRSISSFSSFTRLSQSTSDLLADLGSNTTVLAPLNSAIEALPRKPWESPAEATEAGDGGDGQDRANRNLERFVLAHLVARAPWQEGQRAQTLAGREVWWEKKGKEGKRVIMPDAIEVGTVASRVANGELVGYVPDAHTHTPDHTDARQWLIDGVLNYE